MYEHRTHRLLKWPEFFRRAAKHVLWALVVILASVGIGTVGYRTAGHLSWIDAFLNASMILGGMGPVNPLKTSGARVFASVYALFSGVIFIALMGIVLSPLAHRMLHNFHLDDRDLEKKKRT